MRLKCALSCAILSVSVATASALAEQQHPLPVIVIHGDKGQELHEYMTRLAEWGFHGSVLAAQKGTIYLHNAYGIGNPETNQPWTTQSPAAIGSVTKQFTAAAIMKLAEQKRLTLNDPITEYFGNVPEDRQGITIHHLLTHTAGLPQALGDDFEALTRDDFVSRFMECELLWPPGTRYEYSNVGYSMLAVIVELLGGEEYEQFLRDQFFDPLAMDETGWRLPNWESALITRRIEPGADHNSIMDMPQDRWYVEGNGGLLSTCSDMYRWYRALWSDALLSVDSRAAMFTPYVPEDPEGHSHYGYGWVVQPTRRGGDVIWHNGGGAGGTFAMYQYVNDSAVLIVFSNARMDGLPPSDEVAITLSMLLFGEDVPMPPEVAEVKPERLAELAGKYALESDAHFDLTASDDGLQISPYGQAAMSAIFPNRMPDMIAELNDKTGELMHLLAAHDFEAAAGFFDDRMADDDLVTMLRDGWKEWDTLGAMQSLEIQGTRLAMGAETYCRLHFEHGDMPFKVAWMEGQCVGLRDAVPPAKFYRPISDTLFASFSLGRPGSRLSFTSDGSLNIEAPTGTILAKRVE